MILAHAVALSLLLADIPAPVTSAVVRYESALQELEAKRKGASVQRVYEAALAAADAIGKIRELSEEDAKALGRSLPALRVAPAAAPFVDAQFFQELAERHGTAADKDFFTALARSPRADCTRFGDGDLLAAYKGWFTVSRKHNPAYRSHVIEEIQRLEHEITTSTCMCEDAETVKRSMSAIARDFPMGKITPRVRQRIQEIDRGTSDMRFECGTTTQPALSSRLSALGKSGRR